MNPNHTDFKVSAGAQDNPFMPTAAFAGWLDGRRRAHDFRIEQIPFSGLEGWSFETATGNLVHASGRFFRIEGIWVETNYGEVPCWSQPIINQPEIGILGILARRVNGILYFLMQAKMEPGNIGTVQLAPTLQATRSNFTRVHQGGTPPYLEYFQNRPGVRTLVDVLQSEQGARFLRKRNRNMIVEVDEEVPVLDDYCWLTLAQIRKCLREDNLVNMDARTVIGSIPFVIGEDDAVSGRSLHSIEHILSWFTEMKFRYDLSVERIPLKQVLNWRRTEDCICHDEGKYFSVIAVRVQAPNREVAYWTQPLVKPAGEGVIAFVTKRIDGVMHYLVQAKVEPGNFDVVEMAPTVQCLTGDYRKTRPESRPLFLDYVLNASPGQVTMSSLQSEEGGRFYREANRNMFVEADDTFPRDVPDRFIWMSGSQLKTLIQFNNFLNVEARCLLACQID